MYLNSAIINFRESSNGKFLKLPLHLISYPPIFTGITKISRGINHSYISWRCCETCFLLFSPDVHVRTFHSCSICVRVCMSFASSSLEPLFPSSSVCLSACLYMLAQLLCKRNSRISCTSETRYQQISTSQISITCRLRIVTISRCCCIYTAKELFAGH